MTKSKRGRYTLEFKQEAVRLVEPGQSQAAEPWSGGADLGQLCQGTSRRNLEGSQQQACGDRRTDGDQPPVRGVGSCDDGARHLGKSDGVLRKEPAMKYAFIQRHKLVWPICVQCRVLLVSVSGYHEHLARRLEIATIP
jgi:putative transposase